MYLCDNEGAGQSWKRREDGCRDRGDRREKEGSPIMSMLDMRKVKGVDSLGF